MQAPKEERIDLTQRQKTGVYYECPLSGEVVPKSEYISHLECFLQNQWTASGEQICPLPLAVIKVRLLNTNREQREKAIELLNKCLQNVINNPEEEKFRKMRCATKVFSEKIAPQKGTLDFLKSVGWVETHVDDDACYIYNNESVDPLKEGLEALNEEVPTPTLHRNPKVLTPQEGQSRINVPDDFYKLSGTEFKNLHKDQTIKQKQNDMLMTSKMRENAKIQSNRTYSYTIIRIRFPNNNCLEGTFNVGEKGESVLNFIRMQLTEDNSWLPFNLRLADGAIISIDEDNISRTKSLTELGLVPGATVNLIIPEDILSEIPRDQPFLKEILPL